MINISKMMQKAARFWGDFDVKLVPGAVAYTHKGKILGYAGFPYKDLFPTHIDLISKWASKGRDIAEEAEWNQLFGPHLSPGRANAQIPGLPHRGMACGMRKTTTMFGSGWQGLDPEFKVVPEKIGMREHMLTIKKGEEEVGFMTYSIKPGGVASVETTEIFQGFRGQGLGKSMYVEAMRHAKAQGAIKFRSDVKIDPRTGLQSVSEDAARVWGSAEKAGIASRIEGERGWVTNLFNLEKNVENIMKSGEGAAIGRAGTAEVPALVRMGSRLMKSAL